MKRFYVFRLIPELVDFLKSDWFDPKKSFLELPAFRFPTFIILLIATVISLKIKIDNNLQFDIAADIDDSIKYCQVPIGVMALLIPILGLLNANHKSEQTKETMRLSKEQNNFTNYYKHLEEFSKYIDKVEVEKGANGQELLAIDIRKVHALLFPAARNGQYFLAKEAIQTFEDSLNQFLMAIKSFNELAEGDNSYQKLLNLFNCKNELGIYFKGVISGLVPHYVPGAELDSYRLLKMPDSEDYVWIPRSLRILMSDVVKTYMQIYLVMSFDTTFDPTNSIKNSVVGLKKWLSGLEFELNVTELDRSEATYQIDSHDLKKYIQSSLGFF